MCFDQKGTGTGIGRLAPLEIAMADVVWQTEISVHPDVVGQFFGLQFATASVEAAEKDATKATSHLGCVSRRTPRRKQLKCHLQLGLLPCKLLLQGLLLLS